MIALLGASTATIARLLVGLATTTTHIDFHSQTADATSMAISWITVSMMILALVIRPWSYAPHNFGGRLALCLVAWIVSAFLFLAMGFHAPTEMGALGLWHGAVMVVFAAMLVDGLVFGVRAKRRVLAVASVISPRNRR